MKTTQIRSLLLPVLILLLLAALAPACGSSQTDPIALTLTPLSDSLRQTITALAGDAGGDDTLQTAVAVATQRAGEIYATQTSNAALSEPARLATATAIAPVVAELPQYGLDIGDGYVAWLHAPVTIELSTYMSNAYVNDYPLITAADFVLAADIRMDTVGSMSGCGFMFRSNGDADEPDQYSVLITRVAGGYMAFMALANGNIANFKYFYPKDFDRSFSWFNNETNRLAVVARGTILKMYTNGHLVAEVDITLPPVGPVPVLPQFELPPGATDQQKADYDNVYDHYDSAIDLINGQIAQAMKNYSAGKSVYTDGLLGMIAFNQSGNMKCEFENAWLFVLNR